MLVVLLTCKQKGNNWETLCGGMIRKIMGLGLKK